MNIRNGLAMWHYPHRTTEENVKFFSNYDFDVISMHWAQVIESELSADMGLQLAQILRNNKLSVTVHGALPVSHKKEDVEHFQDNIIHIAKWQKRHGLIEVLSFDVLEPIRDDISQYLDFVLDTVPDCKVAVEDFGLTESELSQIAHLRNNERFGYLLDIGHMYIRLEGKTKETLTLFQNCKFEGEKSAEQGFGQFLEAFQSKTFPVFEIHLHNNNGIDDLHYFLEDGSLDIGVIAKVLKEINYDGIVTIESAPGYMFECYGIEADERIIKTLKYWKELCQKNQ